MITEGQIRRISGMYRGRGRDFAYLELAQEHLLVWMAREGLFENGGLVFKGGTAIRKFRLGKRGRFSTDIDLAAMDKAHVEYVLDALDGGMVSVDNVRFELRKLDRAAAKAIWAASTDSVGETIAAKIEFSSRMTLMPPVMPDARPGIQGVLPDVLGFELPLVPLMAIEENLAEKLARFRRVIKARDVYDLALMGDSVREQLDLVRLITCFKVYHDIIHDDRVSPTPFLAGPEYANRQISEINDPDDLGPLIGTRLDYVDWLDAIGATFGAMGPPAGDLEERLAQVNRRDAWWADQESARVRAEYFASPVGTEAERALSPPD